MRAEGADEDEEEEDEEEELSLGIEEKKHYPSSHTQRLKKAPLLSSLDAHLPFPLERFLYLVRTLVRDLAWEE
ncbi:hypothetical protein EYF80_023203 [Liparis tanakae]|uniref:Uncharacterized protein n=1 Tax=Liparis tanakae TaxID=230148 RepID=A0A4Z2HLA3_9TELE|nr:hypothetical protein EYF80_023203 [Liparis tanakae]